MTAAFAAVCRSCGAGAAPDAIRSGCCGATLAFEYAAELPLVADGPQPGMWRYRRLLPVDERAPLVSLGEGMTPLLTSRSYGATVLLKDETRNPTGSHKDRALAVALTHARTLGVDTSVVVSSGSTGVSHAALAARAGLRSVVIVPEATPAERLYPLSALGSTILGVDASVDDAIARTERVAAERGLYVSSTCRSSNPYQAEAPKTIAYEVAEQLGGVPDWVVLPVGGGGTIAGVWRGFCELRDRGRTESLPRLLAAVPEHYDALRAAGGLPADVTDPFAALDPRPDPPPTLQVKTAHVRPPDGAEALAALRRSQGHVLAISDDRALAAQREFGAREGIYLEPSSASAVAAYELALAERIVSPQETTVIVLTGSGFRETFAVGDLGHAPVRAVPIDELTGALEAMAPDRPGTA